MNKRNKIDPFSGLIPNFEFNITTHYPEPEPKFSHCRIEKAKTKETRDFPGGIFSKLEASFHANLKSTGGISGRQQGGGSNRDTRARGRQTQVRF